MGTTIPNDRSVVNETGNAGADLVGGGRSVPVMRVREEISMKFGVPGAQAHRLSQSPAQTACKAGGRIFRR